MEQYDLMYNIVDNPESNVMDFKQAGFNAENTTLKDISVYLEDPYIKEQFTENGIFQESKVREAYDNASIMYNIMATDSYNEYVKLSIPWGKYNTDVDLSLRSQGPRYTMIAESNPMHIAWSMQEIGQAGQPAFSPSENAQTENILTNPSEVFANGEDNPDWSVAVWDDSPNETFFSNFFTPLVLAQYDSDGTHIDPITGQRVEHTKGSLKLNQKGNYYYEYLDGRDIYGRQLLNKTDIITQDGSWLNQFDFFDCDDINQKSFVGTVMRNLALVGTMYIPGIGPWITLLGMIPQLATMTATLGKMIVGSDSPNLSALEGWGKSLDKFSSSTLYAQEHPWCLENLVNLMGMVAGQLQEQRIFFEYIPAIFNGGKNMYNEETSKAVLAKFAEEEGAIFSKQAKNLADLAAKGKVSMQEMQQLSHIKNILNDNSVFKTYIETAAQARMTAYMKNYNKIGSILSKGYMTMLTVQDTYGEAKLAGASDLEAVALTLGYAAGEAWILNTGIGEWILPELRYEREFNKQVIRTLFKDNMETVKQLEKQFLKNGMSSSTPLKRSFFKEVFKIGNSLAEESSVVARTGRALLANGIGEGIEETTEELLADFSKACFNVVNDWRGDDTRIDAFEYNYETGEFNGSGLFNRYALSFVGGLGGGAIFAGIKRNYRQMKQISSMTHQQAIQELIYRIRNGKYDELIRDINRYQLGNKHLSAYRYEEVGDSYVLAQGTPTDNLDQAVKKIAIDQINMVKDLLEATGGNISDQSFLASQADMIKGLRHAAIVNTSAAGQLLRTYNTTLSELFKLTTDVNAEKLKLKDRNGNGTIEDSEETKAKQLTEAEKQSIRGKIDELEAKRKEKEQYLKDLIEGKKKKEFIQDALFEISTGIFGRETLSTFTFYAENKEGKKISEIPESRLKELKKEYATFKQTNSAERTRILSQLYAEIAGKTSDLLNNAANEYNQTDQKIQQVIQSLIAINNPITSGEDVLATFQENIANALLNLDTDEADHLRESLNKLANYVKTRIESTQKAMQEKIDAGADQNAVQPYKNHIAYLQTLHRYGAYYLYYINLPKLVNGILQAASNNGSLNSTITNQLLSSIEMWKNTIATVRNQLDNLDNMVVTVQEENQLIESPNAFSTFFSRDLGQTGIEDFQQFEEENGREEGEPLYEFIDQVVEGKFIELEQNINSFKNKTTKLEQLINQFALSIGTPTTITITDLLQAIQQEITNAGSDLNILEVNSTIRSQAEEMLNLLKIFRMAIAGAKQNAVDLNNLYGYNATLNEIGGTNWAVIDDNTANKFISEVELMISKLNNILDIYTALDGQKLKNSDKIAVTKDVLCFQKVKLLIQIPELQEWEGYQDLVNIINGLKIHKQLAEQFKEKGISQLTPEERIQFQKETFQLEDAIYDFFNHADNAQRLTDGSLAKLVNYKYFKSLFKKKPTIINETVTDMEDRSFFSWLASRAAVKSTDYHKLIVDIIKEDKEFQTIPIAIQEESVYIAFAGVMNQKMMANFITAYRQGIKDSWTALNMDERGAIIKEYHNIDITQSGEGPQRFKKYAEDPDYVYILFDVPKYFYATIVEGLPGSGKTNAVFKLLKKAVEKAGFLDTVRKSLYIHGVSSESAKSGLAALELTGYGTALSREEAMKRFDPNWVDVSTKPSVTISEAKCQVDEATKYVKPTATPAQDSNPSQIIFIDEISKFTSIDMDLIEEYCRQHGCVVVAAGDFDQIGSSTLVTGVNDSKLMKDDYIQVFLHSTDFMGGPKLGLILRAENTYKGKNISLLQTLIDTDSSKREAIQLLYNESEDGLFGDIIYKNDTSIDRIEASIKLMINTLKSGEKITYLYEKEDTANEHPIKDLLESKYKDKVTILDVKDVQGQEGQYYITELYRIGEEGRATYLEDTLHALYTAISRAKQGSISIIKNDSRINIVGCTQLNDKAVIQELPKAVKERETKKRLNILEKGLVGFDAESTIRGRILQSPTTSQPPAPSQSSVLYADAVIDSSGNVLFEQAALNPTQGNLKFRINITGPASATYQIVDAQEFENNISDYENTYEIEGNPSGKIKSIRKGELIKHGGVWQVSKKIVVEYEDDTQQPNIQQTQQSGQQSSTQFTATHYADPSAQGYFWEGSLSTTSGSLKLMALNVNTGEFVVNNTSGFIEHLSGGTLEIFYVSSNKPTSIDDEIIVKKPGKIVKQGDKWVVVEKMEIEFVPNGGQQNNQSQQTTPQSQQSNTQQPQNPTQIPTQQPNTPQQPNNQSPAQNTITPISIAQVPNMFDQEQVDEDLTILENVEVNADEGDVLEFAASNQLTEDEKNESNEDEQISKQVTDLSKPSPIRMFSSNTFELGGEIQKGSTRVKFKPSRSNPKNPRIDGINGIIALVNLVYKKIKNDPKISFSGFKFSDETYNFTSKQYNSFITLLHKLRDLSCNETGQTTKDSIYKAIKNFLMDTFNAEGIQESNIVKALESLSINFIVHQSPENYSPNSDEKIQIGDRLNTDSALRPDNSTIEAPRTTINLRIGLSNLYTAKDGTITNGAVKDVMDISLLSLNNFATILNGVDNDPELKTVWNAILQLNTDSNGKVNMPMCALDVIVALSTPDQLQTFISTRYRQDDPDYQKKTTAFEAEVMTRFNIISKLESVSGKYNTILKLARIFYFKDRCSALLSEDFIKQNCTNLGLGFYTLKGALTAVDLGRTYKANQRYGISTLKSYGYKVSSVLKVLRGTIYLPNGKTANVQAGRPFVLVSDDTSLTDTKKLLDAYKEQLADPNKPKRVKLVYLLTPQTTVIDYIYNVENLFCGNSIRPIGNILTSYKIIRRLFETDSNGNFINKEFIDILKARGFYDSILEGIKAKLQILNNITDMKDLVSSLMEVGEVGAYKNNTIAGIFDRILENIATPVIKPGQGNEIKLNYLRAVLNNNMDTVNSEPLVRETISIMLKALTDTSKTNLPPVNAVYYWPKLPIDAEKYGINKEIIELSTDHIIDFGFDTLEYEVMGRLEPSTYVLADADPVLDAMIQEQENLSTKKYTDTTTYRCNTGYTTRVLTNQLSTDPIITSQGVGSYTVTIGQQKFKLEVREGMSGQDITKLIRELTNIKDLKLLKLVSSHLSYYDVNHILDMITAINNQDFAYIFSRLIRDRYIPIYDTNTGTITSINRMSREQLNILGYGYIYSLVGEFNPVAFQITGEPYVVNVTITNGTVQMQQTNILSASVPTRGFSKIETPELNGTDFEMYKGEYHSEIVSKDRSIGKVRIHTVNSLMLNAAISFMEYVQQNPNVNKLSLFYADQVLYLSNITDGILNTILNYYIKQKLDIHTSKFYNINTKQQITDEVELRAYFLDNTEIIVSNKDSFYSVNILTGKAAKLSNNILSQVTKTENNLQQRYDELKADEQILQSILPIIGQGPLKTKLSKSKDNMLQAVVEGCNKILLNNIRSTLSRSKKLDDNQRAYLERLADLLEQIIDNNDSCHLTL